MLRGVCRIGMCCVLVFVAVQGVLTADDWPQWGGPQRDCVWRETGIVEKFSTDGLLARTWSFPISEGYSGPAVAQQIAEVLPFPADRC